MAFQQPSKFAHLTGSVPKVEFDSYEPEVIRFAVSIAFPGLNLVGKSRDCPEARALADQIRGVPTLWGEAARSILRRKNVEMAVTTPFTLVDKVRTEGFPILGSIDLSQPDVPVKVPVRDTVVDIPQHLSLPNPQKATQFAAERSPYDFQSANASYFVGCYTKWSQSSVQPAVNQSSLESVRPPHLTPASLGVFVAAVSSIAADLKFSRPSMNGVEWASEFYRQLSTLSDADRSVASVTLCRPLMGQVMQDVPLTATRLKNGTRALKPSEIAFCGPHLSKGARLQSGNIPVSSSMPVTITGEVAAKQLVASRQLRGSDDRGLSGMTTGAYTGEIISKLSSVVRDCVAVINQFDYRSYPKTIIRGVNPHVAYHVVANFPNYDGLHFEMNTAVDPKLNMKVSRFIDNKKDALVIDFSVPEVQQRGGSQTFADYEREVCDSVLSAYSSHSKFDPATVAIRHRMYSSLLEGVHYFTPPAPHNAIQTIVFGARSPDVKRSAMNPAQIPELIVRANRARDSFPFHRKPVWGILMHNLPNLASPLVPYRLASKFKAATLELQWEALNLGIEIDVDDPAAEGFENPGVEEDQDLAEDDDQPLNRRPRSRAHANNPPRVNAAPSLPPAADRPPPAEAEVDEGEM